MLFLVPGEEDRAPSTGQPPDSRVLFAGHPSMYATVGAPRERTQGEELNGLFGWHLPT